MPARLSDEAPRPLMLGLLFLFLIRVGLALHQDVPGIVEIKEKGTAHSREYRLENDANPAAWILVPDLFGDRLTKEEN